MPNWLEGQVSLITGAGSGLGHAVAERFVAEGARIGILEKSPSKCETLRTEFGPSAVVVQGDVTRPSDNVAAVKATVAQFGHLDALVANAGIWDFRLAIDDVDGDRLAAGFDELFAVNVKGYLLGVKAAVSELRSARGSVIFTASSSSTFPGGGGPLYIASKHAVVGLMKQLAADLAPDIRVNAVAPGGLTTTDLRGPDALGQGNTDIKAWSRTQSGLEGNHLAIPLSDVASYAGAYVLLASRDTAATATGTLIDLSGAVIRGAVKGGTNSSRQ